MARARDRRNGRLEDAIATLIQNQASFLARMSEIDQRSSELERINSERFARIEMILLEHSRILQALPDAIRQKVLLPRLSRIPEPGRQALHRCDVLRFGAKGRPLAGTGSTRGCAPLDKTPCLSDETLFTRRRLFPWDVETRFSEHSQQMFFTRPAKKLATDDPAPFLLLSRVYHARNDGE
jgi:hypothetical protein